MLNVHYGYAPVVSKKSRVLILGTFPGKISREKGQYYGNPRNALWSILSNILRTDFTTLNYTGKIKFLQSSGIALWDIIASCETQGSLDSEIKNETLVDLNAFLARYSGIRAVFFNGANAAKFARSVGEISLPARPLPSTSPANARLSGEEKLARWREAIGPYLLENRE